MYAPNLEPLVGPRPGPLEDVLVHFSADLSAMGRRHPVTFSPAAVRASRDFHEEWLSALDGFAFEDLPPEGKVDYLLLKRRIAGALLAVERQEELARKAAPLVPFAEAICALEDSRLAGEDIDGRAAAATLGDVESRARELHDRLKAEAEKGGPGDRAGLPSVTDAWRASARCRRLREVLEGWFRELDGYDPEATWWVRKPYERAAEALGGYAEFLAKEVCGRKEGEGDPVVGDPVGPDALAGAIGNELIAYAPRELVEIGEREFAWCEAEMRRASEELGFGQDWRKALEDVKTRHVAPGGQPRLVRELAEEAVEFLESRDLVTVPDLAKHVWRQRMITPEKQKLNPFFWGGEEIGMSFPHEGMRHEEKLMSLRGNNIHFARATVQHELIPGHHLQGFMAQRHNVHRRGYGTPFYLEGWALHWEMLLWDLGFAKSAHDRVGMLFWRMHRAARIVFSLRFHLGEMSAAECVEFLVERVGHERKNAEGEVRRSFDSSYPPLYQAAYMIGGLQLRALRRELVESGGMTNRAFHDAVLEANGMPIELLRALLTGRELAKDHRPSWRFADDE
ncbi:MAG: DUF885 family protein [Planctomycetota bacterium]